MTKRGSKSEGENHCIFPNTAHRENAIIGEIIHEESNTLELQSNMPVDLDPQESIENRLFKGSENLLVLTQRMKVKYNCIFNVKNFPFDGEHCRFKMKITQRKENTMSYSGGALET